MTYENGKLILTRRPCWNCDGTRIVNEWVTCPACKGTGKKNGSRRCPKCGDHLSNSLIRGKVLSIGTGVCESCTDGTQAENICDTVPDGFYASLPFKVYRSHRRQTFSEALLGLGCVESVTDYGAHESMSDATLIDKVKRDGSFIQATKIAKDDGTVCDHIGIFCNAMGYSVKAVFGTEAPAIEADFRASLSVQEGMTLGSRVSEDLGENGTMVAALTRRG